MFKADAKPQRTFVTVSDRRQCFLHVSDANSHVAKALTGEFIPGHDSIVADRAALTIQKASVRLPVLVEVANRQSAVRAQFEIA